MRRGELAAISARTRAVLDELFEAVTLVATGKITRFPIVLVGSAYWAGLIGWLKERVLEEGNIHPRELDLVQVVDDPAEVVEIIRKAHAEAGFAPQGLNGDAS